MKSPHILFLLTDQFRHDAFSSSPAANIYNLTTADTPHLDAIAARGARFSRAYASTPTCTPSRAAILTGRSPWDHGMLGYNKDVSCSKYPTTLPGVLDLNGYRTSTIGKDHFGFDYDGDDSAVLQGYEDALIYDAENGENNNDDYYTFWRKKNGDAPTIASDNPDEYTIDFNTWRATNYVASEDENDHPTAWTGDKSVEYIKNFDFDGEESMFLKASFHRPHSPYDPPKRLHDKYKNRLGELPARFLCEEGWDSGNKNRTEMLDDAWKGDCGDELARETRAGYFGSIEFVDENIGKIIAALENKKVLDDVWIVWTSDHGDMQGDHFLWRKGFAYEGSTHVPLVITWPMNSESDSDFVQRGEVINGLVEMRDVAPTIWDIAGVLDGVKDADPLVTGLSMLPLLSGETTSLRDYIDLEHNFVFQPKYHWNGFVSEDGFKYVYDASTGDEQLFDLNEDPYELVDLGGVEVEKVEYWRGKLVEQFKREGRGSLFLTEEGFLIKHRLPLLFSPSYPCYTGYVPFYIPHE